MIRIKEKRKIALIAILVACACFLTYLFSAVVRTGTVFTHFFYIPIILASLWWRRKGLVVAMFLAAFLIFSNMFFRVDVVTVHDYLRALMFILISCIVAELSKTRVKGSARGAGPSLGVLPNLRDFRESTISEAEQQYLRDLMSFTGGSIKAACEISGLSRPRLYALLKKYAISRVRQTILH